MKKVKIIGIQRSGTNFLSTLLEDNYDVTSIDTGQNRKPGDPREYFWKHSYKPEQYIDGTDNSSSVVVSGIEKLKKDKIPTILITKNPYFWVESIKRNSGDIGIAGISFVKWNNIKPIEGKKTIGLAGYGYFDLENVCKMWTEYHEYWIENKFSTLHVIRYEDLLSDTDEKLEEIRDLYNFERKSENISIPSVVHMSGKIDKETINRSIEQKEPKITDIEEKVMTSVLTKNVMEYYNYSLRTI